MYIYIYIFEGHSINKGIFFKKCKLYIVWYWFVEKIVLSHKNTCFEAIQNCGKASSAPGLNRGLPSNFCWLKSANHVKFIEECLMGVEKHVLVKKIFTDGLNMGLLLQIEQRSVIKFLLAEKYKSCEIYWRMCSVNREA